MGCIYRQGRIYWLKYYRNGKAFYESSHSDKKTVAQSKLKEREGEIAKGQVPGVVFAKIRFDELAEDFLSDYRINGRKSLDRAELSVDNLKIHFEGWPVVNITTTSIRDYISRRLEGGLSNASINRELAALKRMFKLGMMSTPPKVGQMPYIPMLKESNARKGFFEHNEYLTLQASIPNYLKAVIAFAYYTGWRLGEILGLTWDKVDLNQRIVRLDPGETKNDEARTIYLNDDLLVELRHLLTISGDTPYVFTYNGHQIQYFRKSWISACKKAGLEGRLFHDFRRTAIRNMIRAGIPERIAMARSGHKTRSVFDRYNIVGGQDHIDAAEKLQKFVDEQPLGENVVRLRKVG